MQPHSYQAAGVPFSADAPPNTVHSLQNESSNPSPGSSVPPPSFVYQAPVTYYSHATVPLPTQPHAQQLYAYQNQQFQQNGAPYYVPFPTTQDQQHPFQSPLLFMTGHPTNISAFPAANPAHAAAVPPLPPRPQPQQHTIANTAPSAGAAKAENKPKNRLHRKLKGMDESMFSSFKLKSKGRRTITRPVPMPTIDEHLCNALEDFIKDYELRNLPYFIPSREEQDLSILSQLLKRWQEVVARSKSSSNKEQQAAVPTNSVEVKQQSEPNNTSHTQQNPSDGAPTSYSTQLLQFHMENPSTSTNGDTTPT